jgi:hypothetical protein
MLAEAFRRLILNRRELTEIHGFIVFQKLLSLPLLGKSVLLLHVGPRFWHGDVRTDEIGLVRRQNPFFRLAGSIRNPTHEREMPQLPQTSFTCRVADCSSTPKLRVFKLGLGG